MKTTALFLGSFAVVSVSLWQSGVNAEPWSRMHHASLCSTVGGSVTAKGAEGSEVVGLSLKSASHKAYCPLIVDGPPDVDGREWSLTVLHNGIAGAQLHVCFTFADMDNNRNYLEGARCTAAFTVRGDEDPHYDVIREPFAAVPPRANEVPYLYIMGSSSTNTNSGINGRPYNLAGYVLQAR